MINGNYINYMNYLGILKQSDTTRHTRNESITGIQRIRGSDYGVKADESTQRHHLAAEGGRT